MVANLELGTGCSFFASTVALFSSIATLFIFQVAVIGPMSFLLDRYRVDDFDDEPLDPVELARRGNIV